MKLFLSVVVVFLGLNVLAQSVADQRGVVKFVRATAVEQLRTAGELVKKCDEIEQVVQRRKLVLDSIAGHTQLLKVKNVASVTAVLDNAQKASEILDWAKTDCVNKMNRAQTLTEMYLVHIDTELMLIEKELNETK